MKIMVETSARHVHVTKSTLAALFGEGYQLTNKKDLSQPGQFACFEKVTVVGPKGELVCSILGPERPDDQVELSFSDARKIGINPPVRESGDVKGTPGCMLIGPKGEEFGLKDKQVVSVKTGKDGRELIFGDVVVRVSPRFAPAMHIDTDESNAACAPVEGEILV